MNQRDQIKTWPLFCVLGVVLLLADQWVKWWTVQTFSAPAAGGAVTADAPRPLIDGVVELTRVHNYGAAWSSFSGSRWLLVGVTCAIVAVVAAVLLRRDVRHPLGLAAGTLIIAGGIGFLTWDDIRANGYHFSRYRMQANTEASNRSILCSGRILSYWTMSSVFSTAVTLATQYS